MVAAQLIQQMSVPYGVRTTWKRVVFQMIISHLLRVLLFETNDFLLRKETWSGNESLLGRALLRSCLQFIMVEKFALVPVPNESFYSEGSIVHTHIRHCPVLINSSSQLFLSNSSLSLRHKMRRKSFTDPQVFFFVHAAFSLRTQTERTDRCSLVCFVSDHQR